MRNNYIYEKSKQYADERDQREKDQEKDRNDPGYEKNKEKRKDDNDDYNV